MNRLNNLVAIIKRWLNRNKLSIIQFDDGTYGIKEKNKFMDLAREGIYTTFWDLNSRWIADCKQESLDVIIDIFSKAVEERKPKKKVKGYTVITYEGEKNVK